MTSYHIQTKRIYEAPGKKDGYRVLVDKLWPRGVSKDKAAIDLWLKAIAPTTELREWFGHKPERFNEFATKYIQELNNNPAVDELEKLIYSYKNVSLLYAARDTVNNHANVLKQYMDNRLN